MLAPLRRSWPAPKPALPALAYPLPARRVAVIGVRLREAPPARVFTHWRSVELEHWRPEALAAARHELYAIGQLRRRGFLTLATLELPLLVLTGPAEPVLGQSEHDRLWDLYGLPMIEQLRGAGGELLAAECDARAGFHLILDPTGRPLLRPETLRTTAWSGLHLSQDDCPCGRRGWRLVEEARVEPYRSAAAGAYAAAAGRY